MIGRFAVLMAGTLAAGLAQAQAAGADDEAWIGRYLASGKAPGTTRIGTTAQRIEFGELSRYVGRRMRFVLKDGRERGGIVVGVERSRVQVRARLSGGHFLYTLAHSDIRDIHAD